MALLRELKARLTLDDNLSPAARRAGQSLGFLKQAAATAAGFGGIQLLQRGFASLSGFVQQGIADFQAKEQAIARLTASMSNVPGVTREGTKSLLEQAAALELTTGISEESIISQQAMLGTFALSEGQIKELTPRILDMTAALEKSNGVQADTESVSIAVGKAMTTGIGSLSRYGVVISDAAAKAFELADEQEKVRILTEELDKNFAGIAEESGATLTGRMRILGHQMGIVRETVGGVSQFLAVNLVSALIGGDKTFQGFGNNALAISKGVASGVVSMVNIASQAFIGLRVVAGKVAKGIQGIQAAGIEASKFVADKPLLAKLVGEERSVEELDRQLAHVGEGILALDEAEAQLGEQSVSLSERLNNVQTEIAGITDINELAAASMNNFTPTTRQAAAATDELSEGAKKAADTQQKLKEKVEDLKLKYVDANDRILEANRKQKESLADLERNYTKTVENIKRQLGELESNFDRSERSARESFISSLGSAAKTARDTIKERERQIEAEMALGEQADKEKIANLQKLNDRDKSILDKHQGLVKEAEQAAEDAKTALAVQGLVDRFNEERSLRLQQFEQNKADLQNSLAEQEEEYQRSQLRIRQSTLETLADIRKQYVRMFDKLYKELAEHNLVKLLSSLGLASKDGKIKLPGLEIPKLASGGVVNQPTLAMIGEAGSEAVIPLSQLGRFGVGRNQPNVTNNVTINAEVRDNTDMENLMRKINEVLGERQIAQQFGGA